MLYALVPEGSPPIQVKKMDGHRGIEVNDVFFPMQEETPAAAKF